LVLGSCSRASPPANGRIVVALTIDWEGAYVSPEGLDALDEFRKALGSAPLTHFVSAGYFTKDRPDPTAARFITEAVRKGDELAVHLHAWRSLAKASGIDPKLSPSFLTGTDKLLEFEDGDVGFDTDLDTYGVPELRALVRTSRRLLEQLHTPVSRTFRAGGYLGTPKVLQAIREEGFTVDSSATDFRQLDERKDEVLPERIHAIWPDVDTTTQPWLVRAPGGSLLEMPIAAFADYATADEIVAVFEAARARLLRAPGRDVFVVVGFHQETAHDFSGRLVEAMKKVRGRPELAGSLVFTTVEDAAERARRTVSPAPP
jgi:predicted deacetylase